MLVVCEHAAGSDKSQGGLRLVSVAQAFTPGMAVGSVISPLPAPSGAAAARIAPEGAVEGGEDGN